VAWWDPDVIRDLIEHYGSIDAAVAEAKTRPGYDEELRRIGAQQLYGDESRQSELSSHYMSVVVAALVDDEPAKRGAKKLGIPTDELWWILERRLENGERASRNWLAAETKRRQDLAYVPRDRLAPLVVWIDMHPERARQALSLRRIPPEFRAGKLGPVPPEA
jgi:hypothetical protein